MRNVIVLSATGFGLIAVCYGFARFAFGLFLPRISAELDLSPALGGIISGASFLGYCLTIVLSAHLTERIGARTVAVAAGVVAAVGMLGIAVSGSAVWLAIAVCVAGSSTGLASPPLAAAVATMLPPARQATANTVINAGTSAGVALAGLIAFTLGAQWRPIFGAFAAVAVAMSVATCAVVAGGAAPRKSAGPRLPRLSPDLRRLVAAAFLTGGASTIVWSFGADLVARNLDWNEGEVGKLWIAIGGAGLVGAAAGRLVASAGINAIHRVCHIAMAAAIVAVGWHGTTSTWALVGGSLFSAGYMTATGVYLIWGVAALPERPATGLTIAFLTLAVGQTAGALAAGFLMARQPDIAVWACAALALVAATVGRRPTKDGQGVG